jgi:hypothetical protein
VTKAARSRSDPLHSVCGWVGEPASLVGTDGTVSDGARPDCIGGITTVGVPSRQDALKWAAKIAAACRCTQEVRAIGHDPELEEMIGEVAVDGD